MMTDRDDLRVGKALQGANFPADLDTLVTCAEERGAELKTLEALRSIPGGQYDSIQDVVDAVPQEPEGEDHPGGEARPTGSGSSSG